jgi:chorismate mutase/prephenate dehydrogenase
MSDETDTSAALASMRASIDAVDHALVNLLAERRALVAEIFAYKRRHSLALVDPEREHKLLAERAAFAEARGVPAMLVARIFRDILESSHDEATAENLAQGSNRG